MSKIIFTTPEELRALIAETVRDVIHPANGHHTNPQQELTDPSTALPEYLNVKQAAEYLHLAKQTVYDLTSNRKIPYFKPAKHVLFQKKDLDAWLQKGKKDSVAQIKAKLLDKKEENSSC